MESKTATSSDSMCPHAKCETGIIPSNSATNFHNPALAVKIAVETDTIGPKSKVLEVGSGNLRNSLYLMKAVSSIKMFAFELDGTVQRFADRYDLFRAKGGHIVGSDFGKHKYDIVVCTFVLETICPTKRRISILRRICSALKYDGIMIASFRGYPGVRGSSYKPCSMKEGLITPLNTFIKPYSIPEVLYLMKQAGFKSTSLLQKYRVEKPENIHLLAYRRGLNGKVMA